MTFARRNIRRMTMKCPFFQEQIMAYCKACAARKMISKDLLTRQNPCEANYANCEIYKAFLARQQKKEVENVKQETKTTEEKPCIWMKAGVVAYRMCTRDYDCKSCEFDQALMDQSGSYQESPVVAQAIEKLRKLPGSERKCRYMLTGDLSYKLCSNNYECWHCAVDQYIQDTIDANPYLRKRRERAARKEKKMKGFTFRDDFYYLPNHIWMKIDGEVMKIGVDDFAVHLIGTIEKIAIPEKSLISKGDACWSIGSGRRTVSMFLPVRGEIVEINNLAISNPQVVKETPYGSGWLLKIKIPQDVGNIVKGAQAEEWLGKEFDKLHQEFEKEIGVAISDGGDIVDDLCERLTDEEWRTLVNRFLS
jgi:glycine cleavage system H lipoate-binding protein